MSDRPRLRLYLSDDLAHGGQIALSRDQSHYLLAVMRAETGENVLLFNGRHGEWLARLERTGKAATMHLDRQTRPQTAEPDIWLLAAPLKKDRWDLVAEKAAELGASALWPVITRRTVVGRVNTDRLGAHLAEAAEQCERLSVPTLYPPTALDRVLDGWDPARPLIFLDESGQGRPLPTVLTQLAPSGSPPPPLAVLVGPEGGFTPEERDVLARQSFAHPVGLGPRILRAETAAIAALAVIGAQTGGWQPPLRPDQP